MKRIFSIVLALCFVLSLCACGTGDSDIPETNNVIIVVEGYGEIHVTLTPEHAPITVKNFKMLVSKGAYDGTIFHRVVNNFVIQGGDTTLTSYGKADAIKGEFASNGVNNTLSHKRGVISMARVGGMNNSATSQFFIMHKDRTTLDGDYAAFGYVTEGMDVVDAIASVPTNSWDDRPYVDVVVTTIKFAD